MKCYQSLAKPEFLERAKTAVKFMQSQFEDSFEVYYLFFEVNESLDEEEIESTFMRMVMSVDLDVNFDRIILLLKQYSNRSFHGINKCLDYIFTKIGSTDKEERIETIVATKLVFNTVLDTTEDNSSKIRELHAFIQLAERTLTKQLSLKVKTSGIALLWNQGMKSYREGQFQECLDWLQIALSRLFFIEYSINQDRGKVLRGIQNCYIAANRYEEAIAVMSSMEEADKLAILTQYNLFKAYLGMGQEEECLKCIQNISSIDDPISVLATAACIIEGRDSMSKAVTVKAMMKLLSSLLETDWKSEDFIKRLKSHEIVIPVAIRCTIILLCTEIEELTEREEIMAKLSILQELLQKTCVVAKNTTHNSQTKKEQIFTTDDLEWFASKAYNTAIICFKQKTNSIGSELCEFTIQFIDLISPCNESTRRNLLFLWKVRANVLSMLFSCSSNDLGTVEWNIIRERCVSVKEEIKRESSTNSEGEWVECHKQILLFQFQAELTLGSIQSLFDIIEESRRFKPRVVIQLFEIFANFIADAPRLAGSLHRRQLLGTMIELTLATVQASQLKLVVNWMRLLLNSNETNYGLMEEGLIVQLYRSIKLNIDEATIPTFEIEWFSTATWNHGVVLIM